MSKKDKQAPDTLQQTTVQVQGKNVIVTLDDARKIKTALENYLASSDQISQLPFFTKESVAWIKPQSEVWINPEGQVYVGVWLLDATDKGLVLHYRPVPTTRVGYRYNAYLSHTNCDWTVTSLSWDKIHYQQR